MRQCAKVESKLSKGKNMERKNHTKNFKAIVVLAAIKSQKTTNEIASELAYILAG
jgi:hypothetical protein